MAARTGLVLALLVGLAFGGLQLRLAHSPISMSFAVPPVENAVNRALSGLHFEIGDAVLRQSVNWPGIEFRLKNVRLLDEAGKPVIESPFAAANISLAALLTGQVAAGQVDLIGPRLYLQYSDNSGLALSFADPKAAKGDLQADGVTTQASSSDPVRRGPSDSAIPADPSAVSQNGMIRSARGRAVGLTRAITDLFEKTRQGQSAYLTSFGIQDAYVYFDHGEQITRWSVPEADMRVTHAGGESAVEGKISVESPSEAFQVFLRAEQNRDSGQLTLNLGVDDLVPRAFSAEFPSLRLPAMWDMPMTVAAQMDLGGNGDILAATIQARLKQGRFYAPWDEKHPAVIDSGYMDLSYSREQGLIQLADSELQWGDSRIKLSGLLQRQRETGLWAFLFGADEIKLGAQQFGLPVIPLDRLQAQGRYDPQRGAVGVDRFLVQAADAYISLAGNIVQGRKSPGIRMSGQISAMPVAFFKLIWPKFIANGAWDWIGTRVPSGRITGGSVDIDIPADQLAELPSGGSLSPDAVDFRLNMEDLKVFYVEDLPPMHIPKGTARVAGQRFFFNVPKSTVIAPSGEAMHFSDGQFIVGDLRPEIPNGEIHFKSQANAPAVLSLLDHPNLGYVSALEMPVPEVQAEVASTFSIAMPMIKELKFKDMELNGRSTLTNVRATNLPGGFGVHGGNLNFDVSEKAVEARGELKTNGIPVLVSWQRIFDAPPGRQPPLRLRTVLDEKARKELGFDVDHLIRGGAAAELTVNFREQQDPRLHFELNLSEADLIFSSLGWRKPPGRRAVLNFDVMPQDDGALQVQNINLRGDDLSVQGVMQMNADGDPAAFDFPVVSLNAETQMAINGRLDADRVWKIRIKGRSYDGRRFFRSLFSAGKLVENQPEIPDDAPGVDVEAEIDTVVGFFNTTLKSVKVTGRRRDNKLSYLDLHGQLNGQRPLAARIKSTQGQPRQILAEATDAGAAFRLVGFYPSARGGDVSLKVNLDGKGARQKSGMLYARDFVISDDQVVEEVLSSGGEKRQATRRRGQQPTGAQLRFDRMRVPFSVGNGRFILHDAAINGPALGATLRGAIDFKSEQINLAGTYVPLYGINGALGVVPILGDLLVSRSGEGLFGITFAVKGSTSKPNVLVNPMSMVAPGFLRQLFEFDQNPPQVIQTPQERPKDSGGQSSSLPPVTR